MPASIIVQSPSEGARQLVLLFHGVGALPENMVSLGRAIAEACPEAAVVSVASPDPSDFGGGFQWFSVRGISEDNRPARIDEAMPGFIACVQNWQSQFHIGADATTLIGFSQGGIMALEATQQPVALARRIIGLSTRFAAPPHKMPWAHITLIHGDQDPVIASAHAEHAKAEITALDGSVTLDIIPGMAHQINHVAIQRIIRSLPTV